MRKTYDELVATSAGEKEFTAWITTVPMEDLLFVVHKLEPHQPYRQLADRVIDVRIAQLGGKKAKLAIWISVASVVISLYAATKKTAPIVIVQPQSQSSNSTIGSVATIPPAK